MLGLIKLLFRFVLYYSCLASVMQRSKTFGSNRNFFILRYKVAVTSKMHKNVN